MARLNVEEGGRTRRFRLNEGTLTIGSGQGATLTVESPGVAEVHADLEFREGKAVLRPRPGVAPISVGGRKVSSGEVVLRQGTSAKIGDVRLWIDDDEPAAAPARGARPAAASGPAKSGAAAAAKSGPRAARSPAGVQHKRRTIQKSKVPSWLIVVGFLGAAGATVLVLQNFAKDTGELSFDPKASEVRIRQKLDMGNFKGALEELENVVDTQTDLTPDWKAAFEALRKEAHKSEEDALQAARNVTGNSWFQSQLEKYVEGYLKDNGRPQARVLMKRIAEFRERYPGHPQLEWCDRMERRYGPIAQIGSPPTFDDLAWEVKTMTWARPRDYKGAFAAMHAFEATAGDVDRGKVQALMAEKTEEQKVFFDDRIQQAKWLWEKKSDPGGSVEELLQLVIKLDDQDMVRQAASLLVSLPNVEAFFAGIQRDRPADFGDLAKNSQVHAFCKEKGLL